MNNEQFKRAYDIAKSDADLSNVDMDVLIGFGMPDFKPVTVPVEAVARMIRWQSFYIGGGVDSQALTELRDCFRRKVTVV